MKPNLWMQRGLGMLMLLVGFVATNPSAAEATVTTLGRFVLSGGDEVFWDGPTGLNWAEFVTGDPDLDCQGFALCIEYELEVLEPAFRLRVAMDTADDQELFGEGAILFDQDGDAFYLALYDPAGQVAAQTRRPGGGPWHQFSGEVAVDNPVSGIWRARVVPVRATDATFRMRAKLEARAPNDNRNNLLYPNLRITPPFEFTFLPLLPPGDGCASPERDRGARRCLRFSFGPENIGGPLELIFGRAGYAPGTAIQRIYRADGTFDEREAGTYEFHEEHGHFHHAGFSRPELFLVTDPDRGTLEPAGDSRKIGFCTGDYLIAQWNSFANDPGPMEFGLRCARDPMEESAVALTPGWADVYAFYLIDNYVEFGENSDGLYVLRVRANDRDLIHETTTADNYSYALIEVVASTGAIAVRERGYGTDPWDPQKQIADDTRYALAGTSFDGGSPRQGGAPLAIANFAFGNASASGAPSAGAREQIVRALPPVTGSSTFLALSSVPTRPATITIYDTSGRVVRSIGVAAGAEGATWDGRGANGSPVGSGLYFARFSDAATRAIARIVVTR